MDIINLEYAREILPQAREHILLLISEKHLAPTCGQSVLRYDGVQPGHGVALFSAVIVKLRHVFRHLRGIVAPVRLEYLHPVHQPVDEYHDDKNHHHSRK